MIEHVRKKNEHMAPKLDMFQEQYLILKVKWTPSSEISLIPQNCATF